MLQRIRQASPGARSLPDPSELHDRIPDVRRQPLPEGHARECACVDARTAPHRTARA
jgi:hypothetical protein